MTHAHTPGPWTVDTGTGLDGYECTMIRCAAGYALANCGHAAGRMPSDKANAALIARAPELLAENERLRAALDVLLTCIVPDANGETYRIRGDIGEAVELARTALAGDV